jgi:RNA polymerase-associated protein RTF1
MVEWSLPHNRSSGASSPNSLQSAPMEESDSDSDGAPELDEDGERYTLEGKFIDADDKAKIMAMSEIKREEILAERAAQAEKIQQNRALRMLLLLKNKKRKAGAAELDGDQRKTSRQRTKLGGGKVGEASTGIDSLKRARAEKNDRQRRRDEDKERGGGSRRPTQDDYSEEEEEEDLVWDAGKTKSKKRSPSPDYKDTEPATLQDFERVRVGRTRFALVCFYPGFEEAIGGCFTRISIGVDAQNGQNIYRMALIKGM